MCTWCRGVHKRDLGDAVHNTNIPIDPSQVGIAYISNESNGVYFRISRISR